MLGVDVAQHLKEAGLTWKPGPGDRFAIPDRDLDEEIFVLSHMTIEVYNLPEGRVIGFNGTTEWALDSLAQGEVLWLPREDQLRELLGRAFLRLETVPGGFVVVTQSRMGEQRHVDIDAERAYARALLARLAI